MKSLAISSVDNLYVVTACHMLNAHSIFALNGISTIYADSA